MFVLSVVLAWLGGAVVVLGICRSAARGDAGLGPERRNSGSV